MRVIKTAIAIFGRRGYQRASTREIAAEAGVNPPALQYYFDSKPGLYYACVDRVTQAIWKRLGPVLAHAEDVLSGEATNGQLIDEICLLQDTLVDSFFARDEGPSIWRLLAWEDDIEETHDARLLMRDRISLPTFHAGSGLVARIIGRPVDDLETGLRAFAIFGQVTAFHLDQGRMFDALGWTSPSEEGVALVKSILRSQSIILLNGLASERLAGAATPKRQLRRRRGA